MARREQLLNRLEAIGRSLAGHPSAMALIGLGSVGRELERLDDFSDLDFFVLVEPGDKPRYLADLAWLNAAYPLVYPFRNTADGYKFLYADGIYGEMAVFSPEELAGAAYAPGRIVWRRADVDEGIAMPRQWPPRRQSPAKEWLLGEALTNLYVGLSRYHRGEKLWAFRFIQQYAVDRIIDLVPWIDGMSPGEPDLFDSPRRFEQRHPALALDLPALMPGYERSPEAAAAILAWLDRYFELEEPIRQAIIRFLPAGPNAGSRQKSRLPG
jgi:lincosamide nucleotidyltransferase B/F